MVKHAASMVPSPFWTHSSIISCGKNPSYRYYKSCIKINRTFFKIPLRKYKKTGMLLTNLTRTSYWIFISVESYFLFSSCCKERSVQSSTVISQIIVIFHISPLCNIECQQIPISIFALAHKLTPYPAKINDNSANLDVSYYNGRNGWLSSKRNWFGCVASNTCGQRVLLYFQSMLSMDSDPRV
jgi:hypothetical protein